ncbi:PssE/Cps14G family polysaccharide biosynthesis glycosyltransferase [Butyrivibrio sp. MC2013]|uniref:PssE/Cps14G family polysaccharide biosynthesis glycosyltransferase n=1 Tax=Butyrivibrio sp. MC2013 TaxID=1280686 RepID=UPI000405BF52|nr:PssE/Cps14G family polysaccharide biosynthesis glycosyltransferase [Butyrivibrio sp. MC2013]
MVFVTLGSQKFQFNRLLKAVDDLVASGVIKDEVFAQVGESDYKPLHYKYSKFIERDEFCSLMNRSKIVITHAGTGAIITAVKAGKKVIAVPRLAKYGEYVDDHQLQILRQFDESQHLICACYDISKLGDIYSHIGNMEFSEYQSNTDRIIDAISGFITRDYSDGYSGKKHGKLSNISIL